MNTRVKTRHVPWLAALSLVATALLIPAESYGADAEAAQALARQNNCFKCHAVDKQKVGPAWKDVAAKYKGNKEAEQILIKHLTAGGKDGTHPVIRTKSPDEVKNVADWILSL